MIVGKEQAQIPEKPELVRNPFQSKVVRIVGVVGCTGVSKIKDLGIVIDTFLHWCGLWCRADELQAGCRCTLCTLE